MICWLFFVCCLLGVRDSVRRLRKREASLPSTVETPTIGRPEAWPGAAMWQQRDPTLDLDGLDHLGQGPLVSPSSQRLTLSRWRMTGRTSCRRSLSSHCVLEYIYSAE